MRIINKQLIQKRQVPLAGLMDSKCVINETFIGVTDADKKAHISNMKWIPETHDTESLLNSSFLQIIRSPRKISAKGAKNKIFS